MATTLTSSLSVTVKGTYSDDLDLQDPEANLSYSFSDSMTNGTGVDQCDLMFYDQDTVASGTPDDIDLAGVLKTAFGATITFVKIKLIFIENKSATAGEILTIGNDVNGLVNWVGAATHTVKVTPAGCLCLWAPSLAAYAVTAATGDILQIASDSGTITYNLILMGTSA